MMVTPASSAMEMMITRNATFSQSIKEGNNVRGSGSGDGGKWEERMRRNAVTSDEGRRRKMMVDLREAAWSKEKAMARR
jgi:hypothetical protein